MERPNARSRMASLQSPYPAWRDEKAIPLLKDDDDDDNDNDNGNDDENDGRQRRAKARNPFNVIGTVILVLLTFGAIRMIFVKIGHMRLNEEPSVCDPGEAEMPTLDFMKITPSEKLEWHRCQRDYRCARLVVPMDYHRPLNSSKDNPKVEISLILIPGRNHTKSGKFSKSPMLVNPGGPGGSGVTFALYAGSGLQEIVGHDQDIIGFDPRGIGETTPVADCFAFPSDGKSKDLTGAEITRGIFHKFLWALSGEVIGAINSTADALHQIDVQDRAGAKLCKAKDDTYGEDSILRHVSTPLVARDMLSIIDAWDEWLEGKDCGDSTILSEEVPSTEPTEEAKSLDTKGKLVYWGFSYGSLLGATFAAMFPDRVGRVILDGVVDADYYVSPMWEESLLDTDKILDNFFHFCHKAGKNCALYRPGDTESDIRARFEEASEKLRKNPIKGVNFQSMTPSVFTHSMFKLFTFQLLYSPTFSFPILAEIVNLLHEGDEETLLLTFRTGNSINPDMFCGDMDIGYEGRDAQLAIMCSDKRYPLNETVPSLQARFESMAKRSSFADVWMTLMIGCDSWSIPATDPPMRWDDHPAHKPDPIKTSFPLLYLSNTYDPVTPLKAGVKMARKFVDAGFVEQKAMGHCSLAATGSCNLLKVRAYIRDGVVPAVPQWGPEGREIEEGEWERCEAEDWPWSERQSLATWMAQGDEEEATPLLPPGGLSTEEQQRRDMMRAWNIVRVISVTHLDFWNLNRRMGGVEKGSEVDWWKLMDLVEQREWFEE